LRLGIGDGYVLTVTDLREPASPLADWLQADQTRRAARLLNGSGHGVRLAVVNALVASHDGEPILIPRMAALQGSKSSRGQPEESRVHSGGVHGGSRKMTSPQHKEPP